MAKKEQSAGVVVFRISDGVRQYLLLDYGKHWDYPKGHLERGENAEQAAIRELKEETGIENVNLIRGFAHEIRYFFRSTKGLIEKSVVFFLGGVGDEKITLSREHVGFEFLKFEDAIKRLTYANAREILKQAENFLIEQNK